MTTDEIMEPTQTQPTVLPPARGTAKTFAVSPNGYVTHFDIESPLPVLLKNTNILQGALEAEGWTPHEGWGAKPAPGSAAGTPAPNPPEPEHHCAKCGAICTYHEGIGQKTNKPYRMWKCAACDNVQFLPVK